MPAGRGESQAPIGKINSTFGSYAHNHVTVIWDHLLSKRNPEERYLVEKGHGVLSKANGQIGLVDYDLQTDYHLVPANNTGKKRPLEYRIINSDRLTVTLNGAASFEVTFPDQSAWKRN